MEVYNRLRNLDKLLDGRLRHQLLPLAVNMKFERLTHFNLTSYLLDCMNLLIDPFCIQGVIIDGNAPNQVQAPMTCSILL